MSHALTDPLSGLSVIRVLEGVLQYGRGAAVDIVVQCHLNTFMSDEVNKFRLQNKLATTLNKKG